MDIFSVCSQIISQSNHYVVLFMVELENDCELQEEQDIKMGKQTDALSVTLVLERR